MQQIPVFLMLGMLFSGKTTFIQDTLADPRMNSGERTLLLTCEEGDTDYEPEKFAVENLTHVTFEDESEFNAATLAQLNKKHRPERVFIEYNGMWTMQKLYENLPAGWAVAQIIAFFDSTEFLSQNRNMRQQIYDKLTDADLVVFNRFKPEFDKQEFHKIVRGASRMANIIYEYAGGKIEQDDIEDPMPFDVNAPIIEVKDEDYAWFFSDVHEKENFYNGKTAKFKGTLIVDKRVPKGCVFIGREIMNCCEADISCYGFLLKVGELMPEAKTNDWFVVTAKIKLEYNPLNGEVGPVMTLERAERCEEPENKVATYY